MPFEEDLAKRDGIRCQCGFGTALGRLCGGLGKLLNLRINLGRLWETLGDSGGAFGEALGGFGEHWETLGEPFGEPLGGFGEALGAFQSFSYIYKLPIIRPMAADVSSCK